MSSYTTELPKESDIEKITNKMESLIDSFDTLNMSIKKMATTINGLKLNQLTTQITKIAGSVSEVSKQSNRLEDTFSSMSTQMMTFATSTSKGVKELESFLKMGENFQTVINSLKNVDALKTLGLTTAGLTGLTIGMEEANNAAYNLTKGVENASVETVKFTGSIAAATAGGAALGSIIPGLGTFMGGAIGLSAALIASLFGVNDAIKELAREDLFGSINISIDQWQQHLDAGSLSISNAAEKYSELRTTISSLSETFNTNAETLDLYGVKFGMMSQKISAEDCVNIQNAVNNMCASTSQMIDENTNYSLTIWGDLFSKINIMSEEQELNMLNSIMENGANQKLALEEAQALITETYNNALQTRGYLTQEEYLSIQNQMAAIREMTVQEMTASEAQVELMKAEFNNKKLAMDQESYENYKLALAQYEEEKRAIAQESYAAYVIDAQKQYEQGIIDEQTYLDAKKSAYNLYQQDVAAIDSYILESNEQIHQDLLNAWNQITGDTSAEANEQRRIIREMYKDLGLDTSELETNVAAAGQQVGVAFSEGISKNLDIDGTSAYDDFNSICTTLASAMGTVKSASTMNIFGNASKALRAARIPTRFNGGFANVGQLFIANEPGNPELIGNIGGRTAVVNNQMILDGIQSAMRNAIIEGMSLSYGQNRQGDTYVDVYIDGVFTERKLMKANERHMLRTGKPVFAKG